jgi:GT2 family glycosyltransferase
VLVTAEPQVDTPPSGQPVRAPRVCAVICCYTQDRLDDVLASVDSVRNQPSVDHEILVVVDHNPALAAALAAALPDVRVIESSGPRGLSGARNTALDATNAPLVAFLDDDATAQPGWLAALIAPFGDPAVVAVGGRADPRWIGERPSWFPPEFDWVIGCTHVGAPRTRAVVRNVIGCNMAFRRDAVSEVGGFRTDLGRVGRIPLGCEETELCIRLRQAHPEMVVLHVPEAKVLHNVPESRGTMKYFFARCYAEGISKALVSVLVGANAGLSAERVYTSKILPAAVARNLGQAVRRRDLSGVRRAATIVAGFTTTAFGYGVGRLTRRGAKRGPTA